MSDIRIEPFTHDMAAEACGVLARAFLTNPLHIAAFGAAQYSRNERFFGIGLAGMKGAKWVATDGSRILGLIHWVQSPNCQFSGLEKLRMTPAMVGAFGFGSTRRLVSWLSRWSQHDPATAHSHLGPIGVAPEAQGRRIGRRLMEKYCEEIDRRREPGYLETDRPENVEFYRRFGFETTREIRVLGVPNFLMSRR